MNTIFTRAAPSIIPRASSLLVSGGRRCFAAGGGGSTGNPVGDAKSKQTFKQAWLTDPSAYPIIVVLGGALTMASCFMFYKFRYCDDVRVTSSAKGHVLRTWTAN